MLHALIQLVESDDGPFQQDCLSQFSLNIDNFGAVARLEHLAKIDLTLQLKQNAFFLQPQLLRNTDSIYTQHLNGYDKATYEI